MLTLSRRIPFRFVLLALALSIFTGCDTEVEQKPAPGLRKLSEAATGVKKKDSKPNKELDKSPEQVKNEALEQVSKNLDKANEALKERIKNGDKDAKKSEKSKKIDPNAPKAFAMGNTPYVELDPEKKNKRSDRAIPLGDKPANSSRYAEIMGPGQNSPTSKGDTLSFGSEAKNTSKKNTGSRENAFAQSDLNVVNGSGTSILASPDAIGAKADENPGIFKKFGQLFSSKKPETKFVAAADGGKQIEIPKIKIDKSKLGQTFAEKPDGTRDGAQSAGSREYIQKHVNPFGTNQIPNKEAFKPAPADRQGLLSDHVRGEVMRSRLQNEAELLQRKEAMTKDAVVVPLKDTKTSRVRNPVTDFEPPPSNGKASSNSSAAPAAGAAGAAAAAVTIAARKLNPDDNAPITAASDINSDASVQKIAAAEIASKDVEPINTSAPARSAESEDPIAVAQRQAQSQFGTDDEYRKGLATRDIVAREASFQRAAAEKREDAVPYLAEEVFRNGMLSVLAARVLAVIGKTNEVVERGLVAGVNSNANKDIALREASAQTLGTLRVRRALPALIEHAKNDKSYAVRSACVAALGVIGDPAALTTLHLKLEDRNEIEFVKQSAALALSRYGDSAGREHLVESLDSPSPAYQVLGLTGLAQLNDARSPGYLISALDSRYDEVWTTAVMLFPRIGTRLAVPLLRSQLLTGNDTTRVRASLALGFLGCPDGIALICRATRSGSLQERAMGCELLARLGRTDQIPLLIQRLSDPSTAVRQTAATALTRLEAKEAIPVLAEAARGRFRSQLIQPKSLGERADKNERDSRSLLSVQMGTPTDMNERLIMLACLRILRGETDDLVLRTLPNSKDSSWPEFDRELLKQQADLIKMYKLIDVIPGGAGGAGALLQLPGGNETLYRKGEIVAGGFKIGDISLGATAENKTAIPPFVTLLRGAERIILYVGQSPEVENVRDAK